MQRCNGGNRGTRDNLYTHRTQKIGRALHSYCCRLLYCEHHSHCLITGLAGSHGPITTFLYFCSPINHQLQPPMPTIVPSPHSTIPAIAAFHPPSRTNVTPMPAPATMTRESVRRRCPRQEICRRWRRKTGKSPKTSMLKRVREKTCVVLGRREARTVEAIRAALVEREAGKLLSFVQHPTANSGKGGRELTGGESQH